ncbi:MAG: glycosyltransferase [Acetobacter sp.]|nr:glycosyltransferase [Acetobacter sp.]
MMKKVFLALIIGGFLLICGGGYFYSQRATVTVSDRVQGKIRPYAEQLANEINRTVKGGFGKKYTLYTTNFEAGDAISPRHKFEKNSILWMGSNPNVLPDTRNFDIILTSTPILNEFVNGNDEKAYYIPLFTSKLDILPQEKKFIALVGNPPLIEDILKQKNISYRHYTLDNEKKILQEMGEFQAAFVENTAFCEGSVDIHPLFLTLAAQKIPMATYWGWPEVIEAANLFNDNINFYQDTTDAERLLDALVNKTLPEEITRRMQNARRLVKKEFSLKRAVTSLKTALRSDDEYTPETDERSLNFDLPVSVGHVGSGDFWLAQDAMSYLNKSGWHTSLTFFNSFYKYQTAVNILVRGFIGIYPERVGDINIFYLAYPQLGDDVSQKTIDDTETYYQKAIEDLAAYDAIATASQSMTQKLRDSGLRAYYLPQFTNIERFYPDYDEKLKTDVLFVGRNAPYRRAVPALLDNKIPVKIYGPNWGDDAVADYLDNQELRKHYSSAKIVLNDTRREMLVHGIISNRIFDATACGTLVISDYMPEIEAVYGDSIPMWKNEKELMALVKYYLDPANEAERLEKAKQAQTITLQNFTAKQAAEKIENIIREVKNSAP